MAFSEVGKVGIRVLPDTTRFRSDLKTALDRIEKTAKVKVQATATLTKGSLSGIRKQLGEIDAKVKAHLGDDAIDRIKQQIENIKATATVDAVAETAGARAALIALSRPRVAPIMVKVTGVSAATAALARLSGARNLSDMFTSIGRSLSNLDKSTPKIAAVTTAVFALSGAALAGVSNTLALGASLAAVAGAGLALPGIVAGVGVGLAVMTAALKDTATVLADLGPAFTSLQDSISANFWDKAAQPIRELVNGILPSLRSGLNGVADALGGMFAATASSLQEALSGGILDGMLANLSASIRTATDAVAPLIQAFVTLGSVGSDYLPKLAGWFTDVSEKFNAFVQTAAGNGNLQAWIDGGIAALQSLGQVIGNTAGILGGLARAAEAAGGASLQALADGLGRISDVVNGPVFQGALVTVFQGAHAAMQGLSTAIGPLGDMFVGLAGAIGNSLGMAGQIVGTALGGIATALNQPAIVNGLSNLFQGIQMGVAGILPALQPLGAVFGSLMSVIGQLAAVLGPVLGAAFTALAPVMQSVLAAVQPLIPLLGGALIGIIQAIAPGIQALVAALAPMVAQLVGALAPILATLATTLLPPFLAALNMLMPVFQAILSALLPFVTALVGQLAPVLTQLMAAILPVLNQWLGVLAGLFAQVAATMLPLITQLVAQLAPVLMQLISAVLPVFTQLLTTLAPIFTEILAAVLPLVATLISQLAPIIIRLVTSVLPPLIAIFGMLIAAIAPLITQIAAVLIPIIKALMPVVITVFGVIVDIITSAMKVIQSIIQIVTGVIEGDWSQVWNGIKSLVANVWDLIKTIVQGAIDIVLSIITGVLALIKSAWSAAWDAVSAFLSDAWENIKSAVSDGIDTVLGFMGDLPGNILSALGDLSSLLLDAGADLVAGLIGGIKDMAGAAVEAVGDVVGGAIEGAKSLLGIASPSKVFRVIGEQTGEGLVLGLADKERAARKGMNALVAPPSTPRISGPTGETAHPTYASNGTDIDRIVLDVGGEQVFARIVRKGERKLVRA